MGQSDRGSITGRVTDPNGAGVANAKITATNINTAETREAQTSDDGNYRIPELKADPYKVTVEAQGFKTASAENIVVAVQTNRTLDFKLEIGEISSVVTISNDEAPVLQTETPVRQTNVTERQVKELPLLVSSEFAGRTPLSFIYLDSNVTQGGVAATSGSARPGDVLEYTIAYTNTSSGTVSAIVVTDATPSFTTYLSSACTTPLPASLTACTVTSAPAVGGTGSVVWTLTGTLLSNGTGSVSYQVRVSP